MANILKFSATKSVVFMLIIPAVGSLVAIGAFYLYLDQTKNDVLFTNVGGRQRMISEQMGAYVNMVHHLGQEADREPLRELVAAFDHSLVVLDQGGVVMGRRLGPAPPEIRDNINLVKQLWKDLKPAIVILADQPVSSPQAVKADDFIKVNIPRLTDLSNEVLVSFESLTINKKEQIFRILITVLSINFVLLLTGVLITKRYLDERKKASDALFESKEYAENILTSMTDALFVIAPDTTIETVNTAAATLLGYTEDELIGKPLGMVFGEEQEENVFTNQVMSMGESRLQVIYDRDPEDFWHLLKTADLGVVVVGSDGKIMMANEETASVFGYDEGELIGEMIHMLLPTELRDVHEKERGEFMANPSPRFLGKERILKAQRKDGTTFEVEVGLVQLQIEGDTHVVSVIRDPANKARWEFIRLTRLGILFTEEQKEVFRNEDRTLVAKNGEKIPVLLSGAVIRDNTGDIQGAVLVAKDITERKRADEALWKSRQHYEALVNSVEGIVWEADAVTFQFSFVSKYAEKLLGYPTDRWLTEPEFWKNHIHPDDQGWAVEYCKKAVAEKRAHEFEYRMIDANGRAVWLRDIVVVVVENNQPVKLRGIMVDITEQKRAEKLKSSIYKISEAVHSTQNLKELFGLIHHVVRELIHVKNFYIALYDPNSEIISFPYFIDEHDETPTPKKLGKGLTEYVLCTGRPLLASPEVFEELVKKGEVEQIGSPSIDWLGIPLKTEDKTIGVLVIQSYAEDIRFGEEEKDILMFVSDQVTMVIERKQTEEELNKLSNAIQQSADCVLITDKDGVIEFVNPAFEITTGFSKEEAIGKTPRILKSGEHDAKFYEELWETIKSGKVFKTVFTNKRKNGELFWDERTITPVINSKGNITHIIATGRDITEQIRARREIERLANFPRRNPMPVIEMDIDCIATYINPATEAILKQLGLSRSQVNNILPENCKKMVKDALENGKKVSSLEVRLADRVLLWSGYSLKELNLFHFYATDITELIASRKNLEKALVKAKQAISVKSLFLANMSHEIRTPLNAILGFTGLIETSTRHLISEEERKFFNVIKTSGKRLMHTVHEILDISQIDAGTYDLKIEQLDLSKLVTDLIKEYQLIAEEKGLKFEYKLDIDSAVIEADQNGLLQAINNIIDNAIKYTEQGKIIVLLKQSSKHYVLSIQDTGIGISKEYLDKLFEFFSQESEGYTKKFQGIGLGMAIAKRQLDLNHVNIIVESTKSVGTLVTLTFKPVKKRIHKKKDEKEEAKVTPTVEPAEKPFVLVVEDDPNSQKLIEFFLKGTHDMCFAVSVEEAKQQLKKYPVSLILLDLSLIGTEDGLDLVRWMRKTETWKKTPVIATTAHALTKDRNNCIAAGCNDYLSKPIKRENLLEKMNEFV